MSDHSHYGEYADDRHDHALDYAGKHHRHYDLEREDERLKTLLDQWQADLRELREHLDEALGRIRQLEDRQAVDGQDDEPGDESWRSTLADYHVASGGAEYVDEEQAAELAPCGCPKKDGMIRHQRSSCTDPIVARLDWYADDGGRP